MVAGGQKIAFASNRNGGPNIWIMNADGSSPTRLTTTTQPEGGPAWSPDGTKIAFSSKRSSDTEGRAAADIYVMSPDGTNLVAPDDDEGGRSRPVLVA